MWKLPLFSQYAIVMGPRSLACMLPSELVPQMRALAETVFRLVRRDKSQTAVHLVSRLLSELDLQQRESSEGEREQRAYLLNLRGVIYAQRNQEQTATSDLQAAHQQSPQWAVPLYNLGLVHKKARQWAQSAESLSLALSGLRKQAGRLTSTSALAQGSGLSRSVLWNLGLAQTALGKLDEARSCWQACGLLSGRPGGAGDLGLAQLSLPTTGPYSVERVWVQRVDPVRARILSVVRYGASCQFGDVVLCDTQGQGSFCDGLTGSDGEEQLAEESSNGLVFLEPIESAGYALHVVQGPAASPSQAMSLTERLREHGLHIEVWSLTMRLGLSLVIFGATRPGDPAFLPLTFVLGVVGVSFFGWLPYYLPGLFPTHIRATGTGVTFNFGRLISAFAVLVSAPLSVVFAGDIGRMLDHELAVADAEDPDPGRRGEVDRARTTLRAEDDLVGCEGEPVVYGAVRARSCTHRGPPDAARRSGTWPWGPSADPWPAPSSPAWAVASWDDLVVELRRHRPGDSVTIWYVRNGMRDPAFPTLVERTTPGK